jgi:NitT/TauT family transport system permease protein
VFTFIWIEISGGSHGGVLRGQFLEHFLVTLQRFGLGLAIAIVSGALLGILIGSLPFFRALLNDTLLVFLALPAIIWAFLTTMWFGIGPRAPIVTTLLTAAPFVAVNVAQGVRAITPDLHRMSAAFGVPLSKRMRHLILPAVMGYLFAGIRFAIIIGWNGVLLSEWFGAAEGVGWRTRFWYDANRYRGFVGWVVIFIIFIVLLDRLALTPLQQYAFRWRDAQAQSSDTTESSMVSS